MTDERSPAGHLLVVDDDDRIRSLLKRFLTSRGHQVTAVSHAAAARRLLDGLVFDLLILDIMMPGEDGLSLTEAVRRERDVPILLLTARGEPQDRIKGLALGADDYLAKPFEPEELALRVASILRRAKPRAVADALRFGAATYEVARGELRLDGGLVRLTDTEAGLLRMLASRPGATFSREELARRLEVAIERSVDVQVTRLRRKLEPDDGDPIYLQTVRGVGYRLVPDA
jgi:two-component system, OmpR family, phosphate regulon response regulator OmpR